MYFDSLYGYKILFSSRHTLQLWGPYSLLLNGSRVGAGWNALITHLYLLSRSSKSGTTPPLRHVPSWCTHTRFYLYLNLTSFSLCITSLSVNAKHTHHNPLLAILVEWWWLINWLGSTNRPVGVWHNWCFEGSRTCPQCSILVRLHVWCHVLQCCKAITCTMWLRQLIQASSILIILTLSNNITSFQ